MPYGSALPPAVSDGQRNNIAQTLMGISRPPPQNPLPQMPPQQAGGIPQLPQMPPPGAPPVGGPVPVSRRCRRRCRRVCRPPMGMGAPPQPGALPPPGAMPRPPGM